MASEAVKKTSEESGAVPPRSEAGKRVGEEAEAKAGQAAVKPAHHARRPMNAFLIFCKRHRTVVRKCYPNLENRAITKILGDWWGQLDNTEKESYIQLAQQYKEAFLKAFPDFKWYKLPAPPLRTLVTRPSNHNKPHKLECHLTCGPIVPGKLADESQMGRLSSLLLSSTSSTTTTTTTTTSPSQGVAGGPPAPTTTCATSLPGPVPTAASLTTPAVPAAPMCLASPAVPKPPKKRYLQGMFDVTCAGDQAPLDLGVDEQEVTSPFETRISEWNRQQFSFDDLSPSTMSSHGTYFTTLPLTSLHSPRDDTGDYRPHLPQSTCCGDTSQAGSEAPWSINAGCITRESGLCEATTRYASETTFHTSKQLIIDFVVDKLVKNESCFQVRPSFVSVSSGADTDTSESPKSSSETMGCAGGLLESDVPRSSMAEALQLSSSSGLSLPPLRGLTSGFVPPHTAIRRDCVANSFCSQPVSYVTASSSGSEIVTWAQDINVSRIVASLTNNNVYINKGKNGVIEVETIGTSSPGNCSVANCIATNAPDHSFPAKHPSTFENDSGPLLIDCNVYDAASLKSGCENALISFSEYSSDECIVTSGCDVSKSISNVHFSNQSNLPQSDLSVKFSSTTLDVLTSDDEERKSLPVPVNFLHLEKPVSCPVKPATVNKSVTVPCIDTLSTSSSCNHRQLQTGISAVSTAEGSGEDGKLKVKLPNTNNSTALKTFSLKEHLKRYNVEMDFVDPQPVGYSEQMNGIVVSPSHQCVHMTSGALAETDMKLLAGNTHGTLENVSQAVEQVSDSPVSRVETLAAMSVSCVSITPNSLKSSSESTSSKKHEDVSSIVPKPPLLPQRQTSVRACKGQRYKQFMKETSRVANKRARKAVMGNSEGAVVAPLKEAQHGQVPSKPPDEPPASATCKLQQDAPHASALEASADELSPGCVPLGGDLQTGLSPWHVTSSLLPLRPVGPRKRERLNSASSCCSSERTFSACSEGSLDALSPALPSTCAVAVPSVEGRTAVAGCTSLSEAVSPTEKRKRKFSESLLQEDLLTDTVAKKSGDTFDFNLDEKIGALPPLSLEDFQIKKKNRKKRCFPILKTSTVGLGSASEAPASRSATYDFDTTTTSASAAAVCWEDTTDLPDSAMESTVLKHDGCDPASSDDLVGSQKRKARRNSIRRLDTDRIEGDRMGADLWIGLLLLADAATSRSKMVVPDCSQETDVPLLAQARTSLG